MFVNKHFGNLKCAYRKSERCYNAQSALHYFLNEDESIARFSYLHESTFNFKHDTWLKPSNVFFVRHSTGTQKIFCFKNLSAIFVKQ